MNNEYFIELFERRLCEFTGAPQAVVVDRCTNAILLCIDLLFRFVRATTTLTVPERTYVSVPMTLMNYGYNVEFIDSAWIGNYQIGETNIYDCAVDFRENMYIPGQFQCLSFHQKKRLPIGKGGAILLDDGEIAATLRRMRHDGRDSSKPVSADLTDIIHGYHMNMSPDEAARGVLLLNQPLTQYVTLGHNDYPNISHIKYTRP